MKISQCEFLVTTEKNTFVYKLFLSLNISDFNAFLCKNCNPPKKSHPRLKIEVLSSPPLKIWLGVQPPSSPADRKGVHTMLLIRRYLKLHF